MWVDFRVWDLAAYLVLILAWLFFLCLLCGWVDYADCAAVGILAFDTGF